MLTAALESEVSFDIAELADRRDESGRRLVVRNGYHQPKKLTSVVGTVEAKASRVNDKRIDSPWRTGRARRMPVGRPATVRSTRRRPRSWS